MKRKFLLFFSLIGTVAFCQAATTLREVTRDMTNGSAHTKMSGVTIQVNQSSSVLVSVKVLLQGAVNGTSMTTALNTLGLIPMTQPYNSAPYNYSGTESVASIPADVTDWVLVELRDANTPTTVVATRAAFVKSDGTVVDTDGSSPVSFATTVAGNYYVAIRHRNHLAIRTAAALALSATATLYDFTSGQAQAYQNPSNTANSAMNDLGNGLFAMWGGDGTSNGKVRYTGLGNDEVFLYSTTLAGASTAVVTNVYNNADYNMNGKVSYTSVNNDETFLYTMVLGGISTTVLNQHL